MRLSMQAEPRVAATRTYAPGLPALEAKLGTGAPPTAPSFVSLLNALASSREAGARDRHLDGRVDAEAGDRDRASRKAMPRPIAAATRSGAPRLAVADGQSLSLRQGSGLQSLSSLNSSAVGLRPLLQSGTVPLADTRSGAPLQSIPGASWSRMALVSLRLAPAVLHDPFVPSGESPQPVSRPGAPAMPSWRAAIDPRIDRHQRAAEQTAQGAGDTSVENLLDVLSRDATAIRARLAADGTWHARFRSADHGPISVRIASGRDGALAVTVRGAREALARLDEDQMSAVLRRPVRLAREANDAPVM